MYKFYLLFSFCFLCFQHGYSQQTVNDDTLVSKTIEEVTVRAYGQNRRLTDLAAAVNRIDQDALRRYNNASILNAVNTTAGVRMEERSPGSYRLNVRGSSLRSPFGVRNVKIYYNDIPFTDPGGTTYLNQLGFYNINSLEVIKGPGSSLYGAGTGGVVLIKNEPLTKKRGVSAAYSGGSFNTNNTNINIVTGSESFKNVVNYQHQTSAGYRQQSALRRDIISWQAAGKLSETDELSANFLYGDLYYQTPGALTLKEFQQDPKNARPTIGATPGSVAAEAAIYQKMFLGGITYKKKISENWQNNSTFYGAFTKLDNPAVRNYARTLAPNFGGRTVFEYKKNWLKSSVNWQTGLEYQQAFQSVKTYNNNRGNVGPLQSDDEINLYTGFAFTQAVYEVDNWIFSGGLSINRAKNNFTRLSLVPSTNYSIRFNNIIAPRVAVLRKLNKDVSIYASYAKGFSPPTIEEIFPTGSLANPGLAAEKGNNFELGIKGALLDNRLTFDISAFYFSLNNTIVQRRDSAGGDFYINAGSTDQKGIESQVRYHVTKAASRNAASFWASHTLYNFTYKEFKQLNNDFSGNSLPGAPKNTFNAGFDVQLATGIYTNLTYQYTDPIALDDANNAFAEPYHLLGARLGFKKAFSKISADIFAGADNLFDVRYSLGNDINAFGGRHYNAAPTRNYYGGVILSFNY